MGGGQVGARQKDSAEAGNCSLAPADRVTAPVFNPQNGELGMSPHRWIGRNRRPIFFWGVIGNPRKFAPYLPTAPSANNAVFLAGLLRLGYNKASVVRETKFPEPEWVQI